MSQDRLSRFIVHSSVNNAKQQNENPVLFGAYYLLFCERSYRKYRVLNADNVINASDFFLIYSYNTRLFDYAN